MIESMWPFTRKPRLPGLKKAFEAAQVIDRPLAGLSKALDCGAGTDAATMAGGRATIKESLSGAEGTKPKRRRRKFRRLADLLSQRAEDGGGA